MGNSNTLYQRLNQLFGEDRVEDIKYTLDSAMLKDVDPETYAREEMELKQSLYLRHQWKKIDNELYQKAVFYEPTRIASYYDYEAMEFSIIGDTKIATPEGFITIKELADKGRDHEFIVYSYDHNEKKVVPAKARNAHYTRDEMTYKIVFDDDSFIIATYGHRLLKRDGSFEYVENLKEGDSMMPFYRKTFYDNENYKWIYTCNSDEGDHGWVSEHKMIAEWYNKTKLKENKEVHYKDFSEKNNPTDMPINFNLIIETAKKEHTIDGTAVKIGVSQKKIQNELKFNGFKNWDDFLYVYKIPKCQPQKEDRDSINFDLIPWDNIIAYAKKYKTIQTTANALNITLGKLRSTLRMGGFRTWDIFCEAYGFKKQKANRKKEEHIINHKIKSIEEYGVVPVYDLTVPGYKNFATDSIFSHNTPEISSALDIFMEESTTSDENGQILQIYSESNRIKKELSELFYDIIDINTNLAPWVRNTPIRKNSYIPLLDGRTIRIDDLANELKRNPEKEIWTYSIQDKTKEIVPGKIIWCDLTRKNHELMKVTFDDGTFIELTPDHEFIMRNGSKKRTDELIIGDSIMPFYTRESVKTKDGIGGYEKVYNPSTDYFKFTHQIVSHGLMCDLKLEELIDENFDLHHINFNKKTTSNNKIINDKRFIRLQAASESRKNAYNHKVINVEKITEKDDVYCMEVVGNNGEEDRHNFPVCTKNNDGSFTRNGVFVSNCKYGDNFVYLQLIPKKGIVGVKQLPNIEITRVEPSFQKIAHQSDNEKTNSLQFFWKNKDIEFNSFEVAHFRLLGDDRRLPYGTSILEKARRIWKQLLLAEDAMLVYRVTRAPERRVYKVYVGNMDEKDIDAYIDKMANNFKRTQMVDSANGNVDLRYNQLAVDQDFFVPVRDANASNPIETLPGAQNLAEIADIEYIQRKLFASLRIPKAFIGFEDAYGDGKNLALLDIRFARAIHRIQKSILQELNKIAIIHLYSKGFEDELNNFTLSLATPSIQSDLLKVERWREKILLYKDAVTDAGNGFGAMSMVLAKKEILDMSEDEIKLDIQRQAIEKAASEEIKVLGETIKQTGVFKDIYEIYKIDPSDLMGLEASKGKEESNEFAGGGGGGGGATGGIGMSDLLNEPGDEISDEELEPEITPEETLGGEEETEEIKEIKNKYGFLLKEERKRENSFEKRNRKLNLNIQKLFDEMKEKKINKEK